MQDKIREHYEKHMSPAYVDSFLEILRTGSLELLQTDFSSGKFDILVFFLNSRCLLPETHFARDWAEEIFEDRLSQDWASVFEAMEL